MPKMRRQTLKSSIYNGKSQELVSWARELSRSCEVGDNKAQTTPTVLSREATALQGATSTPHSLATSDRQSLRASHTPIQTKLLLLLLLFW